VLYVEDHPINVLVMQALFTRRPALRLVVATTGQAGWEAALAQRIDLLMLDLHLPDCHGAELLQRLRAVPALAGVPAVAVTADMVDARLAGFGETWHKPLDVLATLSGIDRLLARPVEPAPPGTAVAEAQAWPHGSLAVPAAIPFSTLRRID
jgi:CheY-like chemotaxis protein